MTLISGYFPRHSSTRRDVASCDTSTRVPIGISKDTPRRASSDVGKNSDPTCLTSISEPTNIPTHIITVTILWETTSCNNFAYPLSKESRARCIGVYKVLYIRPCFTFRRKSNEQSIGVSESAHTVEIIIIMVTIHPSCWNSTPVIPVTSVSGKNTAISVSVDAITDTATSFVPCIAACFGSLPRSICVVTFSSTTIASSTTIPIDMDSAERETIFRVLPVIARYMNDAMSEIGIVIATIMVARHLPRNTNTTMTTNRRAYSIVSTRDAIVLRILSEVSTMTPNFTSEGKRF